MTAYDRRICKDSSASTTIDTGFSARRTYPPSSDSSFRPPYNFRGRKREMRGASAGKSRH